MAKQSDAFQVKLPARITGIVFWGLVFIGLLVSVFVLEDAENDLYLVNKTNSHLVAYALESIVKKHPLSPALETAETRIKLKLNQLRDEMGFTAVVLSEDGQDVPVEDVMLTDFEVVHPHDMLDQALARHHACQCHTIPVSEFNRLIGLVTMENIGEFLMIQAALKGKPIPVAAQQLAQ